jgi:hypothetical protein
MAGPTPAQKKISDYVPPLKNEGVPYVVAASKGGVSVQVGEIVQAGASPFAVTFAALGMSDMADTAYIPIVTGPDGDERADLATRMVSGFSILGGADTERLGIVVHGRLKGQAT